MIYITKDAKGRDVVNIHHGDDGALQIPLTNEETGEAYELDATEYIVFTVRETPTEASEVLIEARSEGGSNVVEFTHAQTAAVAVGEYSADAQLFTRDGKYVTVWPRLESKDRTSEANRKNFCIMSEVTRP